jgi:HEAT repeat protein
VSSAGTEGEPVTVLSLIDALKDPQASVRAGAAEKLAVLGLAAKTAVPALIAALRDGDMDVRSAAAIALGCIGPEAGYGSHAIHSMRNSETGRSPRR